MNGKDIGMIERSDRTRFLFEPSQPLGISCERRGQDFDCDLTTQPRIARAKHLAHSARAEQIDDFVRP